MREINPLDKNDGLHLVYSLNIKCTGVNRHVSQTRFPSGDRFDSISTLGDKTGVTVHRLRTESCVVSEGTLKLLIWTPLFCKKGTPFRPSIFGHRHRRYRLKTLFWFGTNPLFFRLGVSLRLCSLSLSQTQGPRSTESVRGREVPESSHVRLKKEWIQFIQSSLRSVLIICNSVPLI